MFQQELRDVRDLSRQRKAVLGSSSVRPSIVSPKWVPQLADAVEVFRGIRRVPVIVYSGLVPNLQGLERALEAKVDRVSVFTAASETFNKKNVNAAIEESIRRFEPVIARARQAGVPVRGYVSTSFWCPYDGRIAPAAVAPVVDRLFDLGVEEVSLGDTIGRAAPDEVRALLELLLRKVPPARLAVHFHDTYRRALANVLESWRLGITVFDTGSPDDSLDAPFRRG